VGTACPLRIPAGAVNLATELFDSTGRRGPPGFRARRRDRDGAQAPQGVRI